MKFKSIEKLREGSMQAQDQTFLLKPRINIVKSIWVGIF